MKIATWNVNSIRTRLEHITTWLKANTPDVLAIQETKCPDDVFPADVFKNLGYHSSFSGQKAYNGVAVLSREPATDLQTDLSHLADEQRRILACTIGSVRIIDLYIPNGQSVGSDKYAYKLNWLSEVSKFLAEQLAEFSHAVVLGDFNIAPYDEDVHDPAAWEGHVLVSPEERAYFQAWLSQGWQDTFLHFPDQEQRFSWWDYRQAAFRRNRGMRIDHILSSPELIKKCSNCYIDKEPRKWEKPSDHTPVIAEYSL